jgi:unsaturated rhamnogalacturonyl hydrolase
MIKIIRDKLDLLIDSFQTILYEQDDIFLENMKDKNIAGDNIKCYMYWEWTQGVGLYGIWKLFEKTKDKKYIDIIEKYFKLSFEIGLPSKNVNTVTPLLTLAKFSEYTDNEKYKQVCEEWANYICNNMAKTNFGGIQHQTSDSINSQELWDDTLFMSVLFLANWGKITNNKAYLEEANYQFLLHAYFLSDNKTGLWYHGWTFDGNNNFVDAFWGRGNCWITATIPEFLDLNISSLSERRFLKMLLIRQIDTLMNFQSENGMWHTLIDDKTSYLESSATCGIVYGVLLAIKLHLIDQSYLDRIDISMKSIIENINNKGILTQVSYGTPMGRKEKSFYKNIPLKSMPYGQALAMLALVERLDI